MQGITPPIRKMIALEFFMEVRHAAPTARKRAILIVSLFIDPASSMVHRKAFDRRYSLCIVWFCCKDSITSINAIKINVAHVDNYFDKV